MVKETLPKQDVGERENLLEQIYAQMGPVLDDESNSTDVNPQVEVEQVIQYEDDTYAASQHHFLSSFSGFSWEWFFFGVILLIGIVFLIIYYVKALTEEDRERKASNGVLFEVRVPRGNEEEIGVAEQMFSNLYGIGGQGKGLQKYITVNDNISFEIVGLLGELRFYVYSPARLADLVEKQILGSYQNAKVEKVDEHNIFKENGKVAYASLELTDEAYYPIKMAEDFEGDSIAHLLSAMSKMGKDEGALVQVVISPAGKGWQKEGHSFVEKVEKNNADPEKDRIHVSQEQMEGISKKTSKVGFKTAIRIIVSSTDESIASTHVSNIEGAFAQFANPGLNEFKKKKLNRLKEVEFMRNVIYRMMPMKYGIKDILKRDYGVGGSILNVEELATIYHFPNQNVETPNINWLLAKDAPAANWISSEIQSKDTIWLGNNIYRGIRKPICFKRSDRRRHAYIVGQTGSGKSWLQVRMMVQDVYNGDGLCFIDPHGSTAEMLLERIPEERVEDVIYFNVADFERPLGFNIMEFRNEDDKHLIINSFIDLLKKMFDPNDQGIVGPILERTMRNSMLTAMSEKGSTLLEVMRIITDEDWVKEKWLPIIKDDMVKRFWTDEVANTSDFHKSEKLGYITSKLDRFVTNMAIRNIIAQSKSSFDFREAMDNGKIVIVNLAKGLIGDFNAQFFGLLMMPKIVSAALSREDIPNEEDRRDFFFYVDEFQNFATDEFASIFSEARKYRLNLTVANQYIAQLPEKVKTAVFGNVGTLIIGRVGPEDAEFLESQFEPTLTSGDLLNQSNIHYYVKLIADGKYPAPFSLDPKWGKAFPESGFDVPASQKVAGLIKQISRLKYGRDVKTVETDIQVRAELAVKPDKKVGGMGKLPKFGI